MPNENINKIINKNERIREIALMILPIVIESREKFDSHDDCVYESFRVAEGFVNRADSFYPID